MNTIATATRLPGEIKTFSQGEQESTATIAMPAKTWNQLLEELENFKAKLASLEQEYATYREQSQKEILFLKEKIASQNTKIAALDMAVAGQDKKIVVLETAQDQGHKEALFLKEKIASHGTKIDTLEAATTSHNAKLVILESAVDDQDKKIVALETTHDKDIERLALEAAYDRQRVAKLEQKEPQPLQKDRGEILRALIVTNGGKMLAKYARLKMHLDKATFSRLLGTLSDHVTRKVHQRDRRQKLLVLNDS
jgi:chromosome segregation ATPase